MQQRPTNSEIVIMAAGAVMLIGSFLDWYEFGNEGFTAWGSGLFPLATLVPVIGVIMALHVALTRFANVKLPERVIDFTWPQVHLILAIWALVMAVCWLIVDGPDRAIGFFLNLFGAVALLVGAIMMRNERASRGTAFGT